MKYVYVFLSPYIHQAQQVLNLSVEPIWTWLDFYVVLGLLPLFESQAYVNDTVIKSKWLKWPVTCEFPAQRPVTRSVDVFFDLSLNKLLSKQSWSWWFEAPSCPLWHFCNAQILLRHVNPHLMTTGYRMSKIYETNLTTFINVIKWK